MEHGWDIIKSDIEKRISAADAVAKRMENAEVCSDCGALIDSWSREKHKEFHERLNMIAVAQERLNRATRSFVKLR